MPAIPDDAKVLVLYGDTPLISVETLTNLLDKQPENGLALLTVELADPTGYGRILRENEMVMGIVEQKDANEAQKFIKEVNTGVIAAPANKLKTWLAGLTNNNAQGEYYLTDIV